MTARTRVIALVAVVAIVTALPVAAGASPAAHSPSHRASAASRLRQHDRLAGPTASLVVTHQSSAEPRQVTSPAWAQDPTWTQVLSDANCPVAQSSPTVADLDGSPAAVVGDRSGKVYAFHLSDGSSVAGWPAEVPGWEPGCNPQASGCPTTIDDTPTVPVDSTPSVSGTEPQTVYVGSGNAACPTVGGYQAIRANGSVAWRVRVSDPGSDQQPAQGVQASLTVAPLGEGTDVVAGSLDQEEYAIDTANGAVLPGWPFFTADSTFSTPAVGDLYGSGQTEIVEGGDSTAGFGRGQNYGSGGHLRILTGQGVQICRADSDQTLDSSPAIGGFLTGGATGIVIGTGSFYAGASDSDKVLAFNTSCQLVWSQTLDGVTFSSPALADVLGNGALQVVEGTDLGSNCSSQSSPDCGSVWVLNAATGQPIWNTPVIGRVVGSVVTADLTDSGSQDLIVPTTAGVELLNGQNGAEIGVLGDSALPGFQLGFQNSALVTDDPNGTLGITIAGYGANGNEGMVLHYEDPEGVGSSADEPGAWPMFHHDPQLTGDAGGLQLPGSTPACDIPSAVYDGAGYDEVASDGGVFSFGGAPFCGSTGNLHLNAPIVGLAQAPDTGGYWMVASDGGVFAFGGAGYYGSMGGRPLNKPIVGIAPTLDGRGYWLVASDGGIFAFGDATFYGSTGSIKLNQPIVGIAATGDGRGYRLVATDGGVFCFGDAQFFGSTGGMALNKPIVAIADDIDTGGYWLVGADGGVFSFGAPFYGSTGGLPLVKPIVGISPTDSGYGYRMVASDGGIFSFGADPFAGSMGGKPLNAPMVAVTGG